MIWVPIFAVFVVRLAASECLNSLKSHCIDSLPDLNTTLTSDHYSGYLDAGEGSHFFYWLIESEGDPAKDPLIVWFNGGPGCSSLEGLFSESGPYQVDNNGNLLPNPNTWTRFASIVYIDTPELVGFSYSTNFTHRDVFHTSDKNTTNRNFAALKSLFKLHDRLKNNDIYLFGESYGSFYVSLLTDRILNENYKIKLAGIIIANGVLDENLDTVTALQYYYYHGFIDQPVLHEIIFLCESYTTHEESMHCFRNATSSLMGKFLQNINLYHIFDNCVIEGPLQAFPCVPTSNTGKYLNRMEVQKQIHVSKHANPNWSTCRHNGPHLVDENEFDASLHYDQYVQQYRSMRIPLQNAIDKGGVRIFFLYGDSDAICNFLSGQMIADYLGTKVTPKRPWPTGKKIFGFLTTYTKHYFATVLGAGHNSAKHKPMEVATFIQAFINKTLD